MQLAHANQRHACMGQMYADLRNEISALRITRVLNFWVRLSTYKIFSQIKNRVLQKRKCSRLFTRSILYHSLHVLGYCLSFWKAYHFETVVMKLKNIVIETELSAVKEINTKEGEISHLICQLKETLTCSRELSFQLTKASSTTRLAVSTDLVAVMPDLDKYKAEAEALRLEAEHQALYHISSSPTLK
jgi:hypothetical protein